MCRKNMCVCVLPCLSINAIHRCVEDAFESICLRAKTSADTGHGPGSETSRVDTKGLARIGAYRAFGKSQGREMKKMKVGFQASGIHAIDTQTGRVMIKTSWTAFDPWGANS